MKDESFIQTLMDKLFYLDGKIDVLRSVLEKKETL